MNTLVSIIVPVYNVEKFLIDCLDSLTNQSLDNIEIICVNDGSTDNSYNILKEYKNHKIKIVNQVNGGLGNARNTGFKYASGDYVAFVDSDDLVDENMYMHMYNAAISTNADVVVCGFEKVNENYFIQQSNTIKSFGEVKLIKSEDAIKDLLLKHIEGYSWNKLYKRELFKDIRFSEGVYYEDMYAVTLAISLAENIAIINRPYYKYRQRENSITKTLSEKHIIDFANEALKSIAVVESRYSCFKRELDVYRMYLFAPILHQFIRINQFNRKNIYGKNNVLKKIQPKSSIIKIILDSNNSTRLKVIYIMWRMRVYDLFMQINDKLKK